MVVRPATWYCIVLVQLLCWLGLASSATVAQTKAGCQAKCGNISIPYPFGIAVDGNDRGCSIDGVGYGYSVNCNTTYSPPKPFIGKGNLEIISISDREIRVKNWLTYKCYNRSGGLLLDNLYASIDVRATQFTFSYTKNNFFAVGCDTLGGMTMFDQQGKNYSTFCASQCNERSNLKEGSCEIGGGCCKTSIRKGINRLLSVVVSANNHTNVSSFDPCGYSFVGEQDQYKFAASDLLDSNKFIEKEKNVPLVLDWAVGNKTCEEAQKDLSTFTICQGNSFCNNTDNNLGYRCICRNGYEGNPYLSPGCQDINECEDQTSSPCVGSCTNTNGSFVCSCPSGNVGDGRKDGTGCTVKTKEFPIKWVTLGLGLTLALLIGGGYWLFFSIRNNRISKHREELFQRNGGSLLKQQLSAHGGSGVESANIFTAKELELATNNYDKDRILGEGGYGTVYKGILSDNRTVAIKKSKVVDQSQIEQFINEVVILTQINHRNVVKLLGCCLETEVPLLVYEYVSNGTVYQHIHSKGNEMPSISWQSRLRIATETAGALAYLHSAASIPIIHRDIKSANILLDEKYNAKVSDFGASRLVPLEKSQFTTLVQGTLGYLDPEYFNSSQLTEKSDVYSFGVVLIELLTGQKPLCMERSQEQRNLSTYFISVLQDNKLFQILDARVVNEGNPDQVLAVAELAMRCLHLTGEERPTMKEVASELEGLRKMEAHTWDRQLNYEKETNFESEPTDLYSIPTNYSIEDSAQYSFDTSMIVPNNLPR